MIYIKLMLTLVYIASCTECANILYAIPFTAKSHYFLLRPIGLELARRGHNVTVITPILEKNPPPTYHEVLVDDREIWDVLGGTRPNVFSMVDISAEQLHENLLWRGMAAFTEIALNSSKVQEFLSKDNKFDVVICEQFYLEATYMLAHKYQAPLVLVTTFGNCMRHNIITRNPLQLATVTSEFITIKSPTSFLGRLKNLYFIVYELYGWNTRYLEKQEKLVEQYFSNLPKPVPSLYDLQRNASLMLINSHFSFDPPTAYLPNIVEIGGIHLTNSENKLPEDLRTILDNSKHGVVYVNFGSNVRSAELPDEKRDAFLNVFRKLKHTVIWKWEDDNLPNKPDNLVIRKWLPQTEILSHPNIKVFIAHGGLLGTQEAIFHGVPIIGIPIYSDQYNNLLQVQEKGFGRILEYKDINEGNLGIILNDVLKDDSYRNKAKEVSIRFKDRPMSALDTAMFWIEYVIRHKGANFIKNPALDLSWIDSNMLDIYTFITIFVLVVLYIALKIIQSMFNFFNRILTKTEKPIESKKKRQ